MPKIKVENKYCHSCGKKIQYDKYGQNVPCKCYNQAIAQYYLGKKSGDYTGD